MSEKPNDNDPIELMVGNQSYIIEREINEPNFSGWSVSGIVGTTTYPVGDVILENGEYEFELPEGLSHLQDKILERLNPAKLQEKRAELYRTGDPQARLEIENSFIDKIRANNAISTIRVYIPSVENILASQKGPKGNVLSKLEILEHILEFQSSPASVQLTNLGGLHKTCFETKPENSIRVIWINIQNVWVLSDVLRRQALDNEKKVQNEMGETWFTRAEALLNSPDK